MASGNLNIPRELARKITASQDSIQVLGDFLSNSLAPVHYNERRQADSTAATEVFEITELCEMILQYTSFEEILRMSATCKTIREKITNSTKLQNRLYFRASRPPQGEVKPAEDPPDSKSMSDLPSNFWSPFKWDGQHYYFEDLLVRFLSNKKSNSNSTFYSVSFECTPPGRRFPRIGREWKDTLLMDPVFKHMEMTWQNCRSDKIDRSITSVRSQSGLTLGILYRAALEFVEDCDCYDRMKGKVRGVMPDEAEEREHIICIMDFECCIED